MIRRPPSSTRTDTLFPYTTLFRSEPDIARREWQAVELEGGDVEAARRQQVAAAIDALHRKPGGIFEHVGHRRRRLVVDLLARDDRDRLRRLARGQVEPGGRRIAVDAAAINADRVVLAAARSEERRVGNECVSTCRSRWSLYH